MTIEERNLRIFEMRQALPGWSYQRIGEMFGLPRQRVHQIVKTMQRRRAKIRIVEKATQGILISEPMSASEVSRLTGISVWTVIRWTERKQVKVVSHPGHACTGKPVLLDPITLQERIARYRPHRRRTKAPA